MTAQKIEFAKFKTAPVVLVSGGASSLAYYITRLLLDSYKQIKIISIDNLEVGSDDNIKEFKEDSRFSFIKYDLNKGIPEAMPPVNCILHLAAVRSHVDEEDYVTLDSLLTNAFATRNLLELARANGARFLLASSINVYQGVLSSLSLKNYFGPTSEIEKKFSHIEAKRYAEALCWEYYKRYDLDLRIVRLGELYGPRVPLQGSLGTVLREVIEDALISIKGDGLEKEHYVYVEDAVDAIAKAVLLKNTRGKIFPVVYEKSISLVELAYLVKSLVSKDVRIDFSKDVESLDVPDIKNISRDNLSLIAWKPKTSLEEGINKTLRFYGFLDIRKEPLISIKLGEGSKPAGSSPTLSSFVKTGIPSKKSPLLTRVRLPAFSVGKLLTGKRLFVPIVAVSAFLLFPAVFYFANLFLSATALLKAVDSFDKYDISKAEKYVYSSRTHALLAKNPPLLLSGVSALSGKQGFLISIKHLSNALYYSSEAFISSIGVAKDFGSLFIGTPNINFERALSEVSKTEEFLMLSKAEYDNISPEFPIFGAKADALSGSVSKSLLAVTKFKTILPNIPTILGFQKPVTYLVLIQNSTELTPLGGVVSSTAKVTLEKGKIKDIVVEDVPNSLKIEDAMASPSFPEAAKRVLPLYKEATKEEVGGVFALDLGFVKSLLGITGPLFISYYDVNISGDNIYEKAQFYTEYGTPASSQKKNFLSNVTYKISENLFAPEATSTKMYAFFKVLENALNRKDFFAYFVDNAARNSFYELNWCADLASYSADYIYALDSNVGATRSNVYIQKSIDYSLQETSADLYTARLKATFVHTGKSNAWPGGVYKNLFRLYVPQGAVLIKATYNNKVAVDVTKDVAVAPYRAFTVFPVLVQVSAGETATVEFEYTMPESFSSELKALQRYSLTVQKQPGTDNIPFTLSFETSKAKTPIRMSRVLNTDIKIDFSLNAP